MYICEQGDSVIECQKNKYVLKLNDTQLNALLQISISKVKLKTNELFETI